MVDSDFFFFLNWKWKLQSIASDHLKRKWKLQYISGMPFLCLPFGFVGFRCVFDLLRSKNKGKASLMASEIYYICCRSGTIEGMKSKPISIDLLSTPISKLIKPTMMALVYLKARASEIALLRNRQ